MDPVSLVIMFIIGALASLGGSYVFWERRVAEQKAEYERQIREQAEALEKAHQARIQETVQSLRQDYERQLRQQAETAQQDYQTQLAAAGESLKQHYEAQIHELSGKLENREDQLQEANETLKAYEQQLGNLREELAGRQVQIEQVERSLTDYETQLQQVTQELETSQTHVTEMSRSLTEYEMRLQQMSQGLAGSHDRAEQMAESMAEYDRHLQNLDAEVRTAENDVRAGLQALQQQSQEELEKIRLDLQQAQETQIQSAVDDLEDQYNDQIRQGTEDLVRSMQEQTEEMIESLHERLDLIPDLLAEAEQAAEAVSGEEGETATPPEASEEEKIDAIARAGQFNNLAALSNLDSHLRDSQPEVRARLAATLGQLAETHGTRPELQQSIPSLTQLSRDPDPTVRQAAISALGKIRSDRVIPILQQALRDSNPAVVKTASAAIEKFKFYPQQPRQPKPKPAVFQKKPENK